MSTSTLTVAIDGKSATLVQDDRCVYICAGSVAASDTSPDKLATSSVLLAVPHVLVLRASYVTDSDGASLYLRLLAPPPGSKKGIAWLRHMHAIAEARGAPENEQTRRKALSTALEGPFSKVKLVKLEARLTREAVEQDAEQWVSRLNAAAYRHPVTQEAIAPFKRLRVLVNPAGGPGKARKLYESRIRPILEAAGCQITTTFTTHRRHGFEICQQEPDLSEKYDAVVCVSGDGMVHEVLNGLATRPQDAKECLRKLPVVPIPTGSGNAMSVCLLGTKQGFNLALACLAAIKGVALNLNVCVVTQLPDPTRETMHQGTTTTGFSKYYSFLSQAIGLMADIDIGTEHMRALGDTRFVLGYLQGIVAHNKAAVNVEVKLGARGTKNRAEMQARLEEPIRRPAEEASTTAVELRHGSIRDRHEAEDTPSLDIADPSLCSPSTADQGLREESSRWLRIAEPISSLYAGTLPYVSRDLLQFPFARPGDGTIDLVLMLHDGGRMGKIRTISGAEDGTAVYDKAISYLKVEAYRVTPLLPPGSKQLKKGGIIAIDGEQVPYTPYQVEVADDLSMRVLSLYADLVSPRVPHPTPKSRTA